MATERNPYEMMPSEEGNIIPMPTAEENSNATFELDPEDGGVIVDFSEEDVVMEAAEDISEWYGDITEIIAEDELDTIANDVLENFQSDKDSRADWESMFERGFDLLGLKLQEGSEPSSSFRPSRSKPRSNIDSQSARESLSD